MSKSRTCLKLHVFLAQGENAVITKKNTILDNARRFTTPWKNVRTFSHCCTSGATLFWHAFVVGLMWLFGRVATRTFAFPYTTSHRKRGPRFSAKSTTVGYVLTFLRLVMVRAALNPCHRPTLWCPPWILVRGKTRTTQYRSCCTS